MNTAETVNFDIPVEEVDIPMEPEEQVEDWSEFDNYEFQINETFVDIYPPQAADWCDENGCHIEELDPNEEGKRVFKIVKNPEPTAEEIAKRKAMLNLTAADVERAIYKAKGLDFDDIITMVQAQPLSEEGTPILDIKALKIELRANNFYRGSEWVATVGAMLGFTPKQLDLFFEDGNYEHLISSTEN